MSVSESPPMMAPPRWWTQDGRERQIGVEIEFANLSAERAAEIIRGRFGGKIVKHDPHDYRVTGTVLGSFKAELDTQYAHPAPAPGSGDTRSDGPHEPDLSRRLERTIAEVVGDIGSLWLPVEIVSPPVPLTRLPELDAIVSDLRAAGAEGTDEGLAFAFGTQLNVEVLSKDVKDILRHFQAFLVLSEWLRAEIGVDATRRILPFVDPFPSPYVKTVLARGYDVDLARFIDDYIAANPTRNRELDMLPLLAELDEGRVRSQVRDPLVKARPTFHYRLPDTRLSDPTWGLVCEWNRWVRVEQLAADPDALAQAASAYLARSEDSASNGWIDSLSKLFG